MDLTKEENQKLDAQANRVSAVLSYLGVLGILNLILVPDSEYARYHTNQGLCLYVGQMIFSSVCSVLISVLEYVPILGAIVIILLALAFCVVNITIVVLRIMGMINAAKGEMKTLPFIGDYKILSYTEHKEMINH